MTVNNNPMTPKMIEFCENYLDTRNATRSYAKAYGYKPDDPKQREDHYASWSVASSNLMKDNRIQEYLKQRTLETDYNRDLSEQEIIVQLNKIALGAGLYKENTRMDALKQLIKIKGMTEEYAGQQQVNINLSSELQEVMDNSKRPVIDAGDNLITD